MASSRKFPHTWLIIFMLILISAGLTWIVPGGEYIEKETADGTTLEYQSVDSEAQTWEVFSAFYKGFTKQSGIIIFILMIGGAFWVMNHSKAIDVGIFSFLGKARRLERYSLFKKAGVDNIIMSLIMIVFALFGAIFGMSEETIAFVIILVPLAISMGYDSIVGVCLVYVAAHVGFSGAILNPFTIGIAQGLADVPLFSGFEYRIFCFLILTLFTIVWVLLYASKIKKHPQRSAMYEEDEYWRKRESSENEQIQYQRTTASWVVYFLIQIILVVFAVVYPDTTMTIGDPESADALRWHVPALPVLAGLFALLSIWLLRKSYHFFILNILLFTILFLIVGVMGYQWYIMEIASLFFAMGIASGIAMNLTGNKIVRLFIEGAADILPAALVVGLAGGIIIILEDGKVIATILHSMASAMEGTGQVASVGLMYVIQALINVVIPSGSAKAALTMPIMAPFSDLIGLSRQATIMAFQFGDGFTNMITPTSGVLIGALGIARIPFHKWFRWVVPFVGILLILGFLLLLPTVLMELPGF